MCTAGRAPSAPHSWAWGSMSSPGCKLSSLYLQGRALEYRSTGEQNQDRVSPLALPAGVIGARMPQGSPHQKMWYCPEHPGELSRSGLQARQILLSNSSYSSFGMSHPIRCVPMGYESSDNSVCNVAGMGHRTSDSDEARKCSVVKHAFLFCILRD